MVDIRFITILPAQQVQGIQPYQPTGNESAPTILATLPSGSILSGYIVNRDPSGNPILRTDKADIVFATGFFLKIGSEVVIRVENRAGQSNAHILSVNGQPPEVAETQSAFAGEPEVIVGKTANQPQQRTTAAQVPDTIVSRSPINVTVTGTLLAPPARSTNETPPPLPAGTQLSLKITAFTPPVTPSAPGALPAEQPAIVGPPNPLYTAYARPPGTPSTQPPAPPPASAPTVATATSAPATLPEIAAETFTPTAPVSTATVPKPQVGETISATVIAHEPSGEAIVHMPVGVVRLQPGTVLPQGSKVTFELMNLLMPPAAQNISGASESVPTPLPELAREWESLRQIFSLLVGRASTPDYPGLPVFPSLLTPNPASPHGTPTPQAMTAGLMVFMAALRGGDFRNWLGRDNIRWLENNGHEALVKHAEGDFAALARPFSEAPPHQWQSLFFPFVVAGELQQVRLFTKRDRKKDSKQGKKSEDTRFVLEVDLSQLGEMQMDGFVRKREREINFDLVIRSHTELPDEMQRDILAIYNNTGELTGFKGTVAFQAVQEFPVNPLDELVSEHLRSLIV